MIEQIAIAMTGATAIWLSQDRREDWRRWACIFGLIGQPFWFYSAWSAQQWGIFALCFLYTLSWARGFRNNWLPIRKQKMKSPVQPEKVQLKCKTCYFYARAGYPTIQFPVELCVRNPENFFELTPFSSACPNYKHERVK